MKRPIVVVLLIWGIGLFLWLRWIPLIIVTVVLLFMLYGSKLDKVKVWHVLSLMGLCFISVLRIIQYDLSYENESAYIVQQSRQSYEGVVKSKEHTDSTNEYVITNWADESGYMGAYAIKLKTADQAGVGDLISFSGGFQAIEPMRNEGGFDYAAYCKQKGFVASMKGQLKVVESKYKYPILRWLGELRNEHYVIVQSLLPDEQASIIGTLLLGLDTVDEGVEDSFRTSGLIHILAISGLHVSIIALGVFAILRRIGSIKAASIGTIILGILYCLYTGGHTSTVRATMMVSMYLIQYLITRRYDPTTALSFVALVLLMFNPYEVMNVGFVLSFSAVASLFYITPALKRDFIKKDGFIWDQLRTMIAVQVGLLPVLAFYFHTVSIYSIAANLMVLPVVSVVILFSIVIIGVAYIWMPLGVFLSGVVFWLLNYTLMVVEVISRLPYSQISIGRISIGSMGLFTLALILWIHKSKKHWIALVVGILVCSVAYSGYIDYKQLTIRHMDVGQGDGAIITYKDRCILIDGGGVIGKDMSENVGTYVIKPFLDSRGIKEIDTVFISHSDYDHIYGIIEIAQTMPIARVVLSDYEQKDLERPMLVRLMETLSDETSVVYMSAGESIAYDELTIECLGPFSGKRYDDINDASMILMVRLGEFHELFLGDISLEQELGVMEQVMNYKSTIEVVKIAHHGSDSSTLPEFYETVQPVVSVISVGKNTYGQPAEDVLHTLETYSREVVTTLNKGEVIIRTDGKKMSLHTMID